MPTAICKSCGGESNSTVSDYWEKPFAVITKCFAKYEGGKWVAGCAYDKKKHESWFATSLIRAKTIHAMYFGGKDRKP